MKMLNFITLIFIISAAHAQLPSASTTGPIYFGKSSNWKPYQDNKGIYIDVDYA